MDDKILSLYAKEMATRDIVDSFKEMYNADIRATRRLSNTCSYMFTFSVGICEDPDFYYRHSYS